MDLDSWDDLVDAAWKANVRGFQAGSAVVAAVFTVLFLFVG